MATPHPDNLYLGAGEVFFDRFDAAGLSTGYRHLGNVASFNLTHNVEELEHNTSMRGHRAVDKKVVTGLSATIAMLLEEYDTHNLALAMLGESVQAVQASAPAITDEQLNGGAAVVFDHWYRVGKRNITVTDVKQGGPALVANTDYEVDRNLGMIRILSTGGGAEAATTWSGSAPALTLNQVKGLGTARIFGKILYRSAEDQVSGPRLEVEVHKCSLLPDGELPLISEEFGQFTLNGTAELDPTQPVDNQFYTKTELPAPPAEGS